MAVAGLVEHPPEGVGRDGGQAIGGRTQRLSQGEQRPGGRAVGFGGRGPLDLAEDPSCGRLIIEGRSATSMPGRQGGQALGVEAGDEVGDRVAGATAHGVGRVLIVVAACDGQEELGSGDLDGRSHLRPAQLDQGLVLLGRDLAERVVLAARHGGLPGVTEAANCNGGRDVMATSKPNDPLGAQVRKNEKAILRCLLEDIREGGFGGRKAGERNAVLCPRVLGFQRRPGGRIHATPGPRTATRGRADRDGRHVL